MTAGLLIRIHFFTNTDPAAFSMQIRIQLFYFTEDPDPAGFSMWIRIENGK